MVCFVIVFNFILYEVQGSFLYFKYVDVFFVSLFVLFKQIYIIYYVYVNYVLNGINLLKKVFKFFLLIKNKIYFKIV